MTVNFVTTDEVLDRVAHLLENRMDKRRAELDPRLPSKVKRVTKWLRAEWDFPTRTTGDLPKGIVDLDERQSERREQDSGETATFDISIRVYFTSSSVDKAKATRWASAYGDAILYTLMMEALGKRPKDSTVLPGWFRVWPSTMRPGEVEESGLLGVEVKATVTIDSSFDAAE